MVISCAHIPSYPGYSQMYVYPTGKDFIWKSSLIQKCTGVYRILFPVSQLHDHSTCSTVISQVEYPQFILFWLLWLLALHCYADTTKG